MSPADVRLLDERRAGGLERASGRGQQADDVVHPLPDLNPEDHPAEHEEVGEELAGTPPRGLRVEDHADILACGSPARGTSAMMARVRTTRPTLYLTVGLPGTGKTTEARRIEVEHNALRLTKDEWVKALYGPANPPAATDVIEGRLVEIGLRALELGVDVVLDFGLWSRDERSALRQAAVDRGAAVELRYLTLPPAEQRGRLDRRHAEEPHTTWPMSDEELARWAATITIPTPGELDGSEPVDGPPAGFATWDEWRTHRWPASVP